jgi:beta-glucanase (GH16 family)
MDVIKRVRWQRIALILLALLIISAGVVILEQRANTQQPGKSSRATTPVATTHSSQALQLVPQPTRTATATSTGTPKSGTNPQWQLIFSDDFNGSTLGPGWGAYSGPHGGGQSYYSPSDVKVQNGLLQLGIEKKVTGGLPYTTGGVGAFRYVQTYGKYEFRVKLPYGKGVGPYAILWPQNGDPSAQLDIFESPPADKSTLYFTNHGGPGGSSTQLRAHGSFAAGFHTLTCIWLPHQLQFLVDGVSQGTLTQNVPHQLMWFGIAVSSGDAFTGLPDSTTALPVALEVDWVHIYAYKGQG